MPQLYEPWNDQPKKDIGDKIIEELLSEPTYTSPDFDYRNVCGNCSNFLNSDRYCRKCGTKRGQGSFTPRMELMECIYGPQPVMRTHKCKKCGNTYSVALMLDDERFCPRCGGPTEIIACESDDPRAW